MASGIYTTPWGGGGFTLQLAWHSADPNIIGNYTPIYVEVRLTANQYSSLYVGARSGTISIDGSSFNFSFNANLNLNQTLVTYSGWHNVYHHDDGSKVLSLSASVALNVSISGYGYVGTVSVSGQGGLSTIPRASVPSLNVSTGIMGNEVTISTNRKSSSFTHSIYAAFGNWGETIATNVSTSYAWTIPKELAEQIPSHYLGVGQISLKTYNGSTFIGENTIPLYLQISDDTLPVIDSTVISEGSTGLEEFNFYIEDKSSLNVITDSSGIYGSTISKVEVTCEDKTYIGSDITTNLILNSGTVNVLVKVTDTRNRIATKSIDIQVVPYIAPSIEIFIPKRANGMTEDEEGSDLLTAFKFNVATLNNENLKSYKIEYRQDDSSSFNVANSGEVYSFDGNLVSPNVLNVDYSYVIKATVTDSFGSISVEYEIGTGFSLVNYHQSGQSLAFGKVSSDIGMEVEMDMYYKGVGLIDLIQPIGSIVSNINSTFNPNNVYLGTVWTRIKGRVIVGVDEDDDDFNEANKLIGVKETNHAFYTPPLNTSNDQNSPQTYLSRVEGIIRDWVAPTSTLNATRHVAAVESIAGNINSGANNWSTEVSYGRYKSTNIQPTLTAYIWQRIA